ncbi:MAG: transcription termination/antitermination protein NusG [Clostridia bacterium]|nr:transcription termination/antitermination protein NusG [Clostridia bacterium]
MTLQENNTPHWYVVHTYSGYENKVATNLEKIVENRNMGHLIHAIKVPVEVVEGDDGKSEEHKLFPSYVLVKMIMNDESWHVVRNTTGVTGFVGPGSMPVVLLDEEVEALGVDTDDKPLEFALGDVVEIVGGPLQGIISSGKILEISPDNKSVKLLATMAGRETAIEVESNLVKKL